MTAEPTERGAGLDIDALDDLLTVQHGVVARRQVIELGGSPHDVRRMLRRNVLHQVHRGVYVVHNGPLTWDQRAWVAVQACWPAALTRESALIRASALPRPPADGAIHVAVDHRRTLQAPPGVVVHRVGDLAGRLVAAAAPPRVGIEHALIDVVASQRDVVDRFRVLAQVIGTRRTTAERVAAVLRTRRGVAGGAELLELLDDLALGACSVLERAYLQLERRHGLASTPAGRTPEQEATRQTAGRGRGGRIWRDVSYGAAQLEVELDGRADHDGAVARDRDAQRDFDTVVADDTLTVRLTYAMVVRDGCRTMAGIERLLLRRGWTERLARCPDCPPLP